MNIQSMDERILLLAPRGRDAEVICRILAGIGSGCESSENLTALAANLEQGAATAIITEEALALSDDAPLDEWLERQPPWSDFPFVILVTNQTGRRSAASADRLVRLGNVVLLERPLNAETLASAAQSALRARRRQYQARDLMAAQAEAEATLRFALEAGRLGTWDLELESRRLDASRTCKANFGRRGDLPFTYDDLVASIHPDDRIRQAGVVLKAIETGGDFDIEYRTIWPDGGVHWVYIRGGRAVDAEGRPTRLTGVSIDITARKAFEEQLRQVNETLESRIVERTTQLREANKRLLNEIAEREKAQAAFVQAQKMEAVGHLTGGIAHDFNNLLTAISGNVELIGRRSTDERIQRMAGHAGEAVERAVKLTSQLLAFSRSQNMLLKPVAVDELIRGMNDLLARSLGHTIRVETDLRAEEAVARADANQLELAILNLAINSRDAMPDGGVLTVTSRIENEWGEDLKPGRYVVIAVSDTGCGIPPEMLNKVFDPFFTTKSVGKGTGLGLSQVYGIARQSGGAARIESEVGRGTTIEIWLPVVGGIPVEALVADRVETIAKGNHERVLVIDDDPDVRRFIVQCLETLEYEVTQADHGEAGLARLSSDVPQLMIVDFAMPGMNGAEVAAEALRRQPGLPVILVTGYADTEAVERVVGSNSILRKPFKVDDLANAMRKALA